MHLDVKHCNETPSVDFKILQEGVQLVNFLNMEKINTISGSAERREAAMIVGQEQRSFPRIFANLMQTMRHDIAKPIYHYTKE